MNDVRIRTSRFVPAVLLAGVLGFTACTDETDQLRSSTRITFTSGLSSVWGAVKTSSASETKTLSGEIPGGVLYLHTLYTDSIASPKMEEAGDSLPITRATPIHDKAGMYDSFSVTGYAYTDEWDGSQSPTLMYDLNVGKSGIPSSDHYWPGRAYKTRFFAYAPTGNGAYQIDVPSAGAPTLHTRIPADVAKQEDLLVASSGEIAGDRNTALPLTFRHALTAIKFVCGDDVKAGTIKSIALKNVFSEGEYDMDLNTWDGVTTKSSFTQGLDKRTSGTAGETITSEAQTFMMIPQTAPNDARIEVVFNDGAQDHTLTGNIAGNVWSKGQTVTYKISTASVNWEYTLNVTQRITFGYYGETKSYDVTSYRKNTSSNQVEPIAWTVQFSEDGQSWSDQRPDWLTEFTPAGTGSETAATYPVTVAAQTGITGGAPIEQLRNAPERGSERQPYNLANTSGASNVENTANCYVVNGPGVYSFPLVYGNAIKSGTDNKAAYTSSREGDRVLHTFVNHLGKEIASPYIADNYNAGCAPDHAELLWQDGPQLVTDIRYTPGEPCGTISFKVDKATIQPGNALIAIKDNQGQVMWSWHIWITETETSRTIAVTNHDGKIYQFLSASLGWIDESTTTYAARSCRARFTANGLSRELTIQQNAGKTNNNGVSTFYQWGRKDPFLPSTGNDNGQTRPWYDASGIRSTAKPPLRNLSSGIECLKNYILHPDIMQTQNAGDKNFDNLWDTDYTVATGPVGEEVVKTIYDPSPIGFKVPSVDAFTGFTTTGKGVSNGSDVNGSWGQPRSKGWNLYTDPSHGQLFYLPAPGWRTFSGSESNTSYVNLDGYYWLASTSSQKHGNTVYFFVGTRFEMPYPHDRAFGHSVYPIRDN